MISKKHDIKERIGGIYRSYFVNLKLNSYISLIVTEQELKGCQKVHYVIRIPCFCQLDNALDPSQDF